MNKLLFIGHQVRRSEPKRQSFCVEIKIWIPAGKDNGVVSAAALLWLKPGRCVTLVKTILIAGAFWLFQASEPQGIHRELGTAYRRLLGPVCGLQNRCRDHL